MSYWTKQNEEEFLKKVSLTQYVSLSDFCGDTIKEKVEGFVSFLSVYLKYALGTSFVFSPEVAALFDTRCQGFYPEPQKFPLPFEYSIDESLRNEVRMMTPEGAYELIWVTDI